jgi:NodT family efflux transporter outer membrane factor (OMF) lipoprotein
MRVLPLALALALALAGCAVGPAYQRPDVETPAQWKLDEPWHVARPDDAAQRGPWWKRFGDPQLDALEEQALAASPTLEAATARLTQARAQVDLSTAGLFPQVSLATRAARQRISANRPLSNYGSPNFATVQNDFTISFNVAYEADLWGRVRSGVESARASAQQSEADWQNVRLVLTTDVAANYFNLRELDVELDVLRQSIALQNRALDLAKSKHELGATSGLDVAQQQALLDSTLTQVDVVKRQRDQFEHAIAALVGRPAPVFSMPQQIAERSAPAIPVGIPSDILQRRPDVASAERAMAAANAQIGVARAAYYPSFTFGPSYGGESRMVSSLFDAPSIVWSLGVNALQPIFDAGRIDANVRIAEAGYQLSVANYKRSVLTAFQEVEDGITGSAALERAVAQGRQAVASAEKVLQIANDRYEGGATSFSDVITAQQSLLNAQRQLAQLTGQRMLVAVLLVKALGGDWSGAPVAAQ